MRTLPLVVCCLALGCGTKESTTSTARERDPGSNRGSAPDDMSASGAETATSDLFERDSGHRDPFAVATVDRQLDPKEVELIMAAVHRKPNPREVARLLKGNPSLVHARTERHSFTLLHLAVLDGNLAVARILLANGAPVDARNRSRSCFGTAETPLHLAAKGALPEMTRLLLANGADPNARVLSHGVAIAVTPLYYALGKDDDGVTRIGEELKARREETVRILRSAGAKE